MAYAETKDPFPGTSQEADSFGSKGRIVTPSDTVDLDPYAKAIILRSAGDVSFIPTENADGVPLPFVGCPVGYIPPYKVRRVMSTGTTATVATIDE